MINVQILLDENITKSMKAPLSLHGHNVCHVNDEGLDGLEDPDILEWAVSNNRVLITQNGRHFVVLIPPKGSTKHHGLLWQKFEITRPTAQKVAEKIADFLRDKDSIDDKIIHITKDENKNIICIEK